MSLFLTECHQFFGFDNGTGMDIAGTVAAAVGDGLFDFKIRDFEFYSRKEANQYRSVADFNPK